jgi:hypothetical protein
MMPTGRYIVGIIKTGLQAMKKRILTEKEKAVLKRISRVIRKKLIFLSRNANIAPGAESPVTLVELEKYKKGLKEIPLTHLASLFEFYGCPRSRLAIWNVKRSQRRRDRLVT